MTDREILLQLQKSVSSIQETVVSGFAEAKQDRVRLDKRITNLVSKNSLKE